MTGFTALIDRILQDEGLRIEQSTKNFNKALEYEATKLDKERKAFYDKFINEN